MTKELEVAIRAAKEAGKIMTEGWNTDLAVSSKADNSLVTEIDSQAEEKIISIIKETFPDHKIVAEESGTSGDNVDCWYIDPIDGTTNYSRRVPICGVSIALLKNGTPQVGVIYNPFTDELYQAEKGSGTLLNGVKVKPSDVTELSKAVIVVSYSHDPQIREKVTLLKTLTTANRTKREFGSAAYELGLLSSGRLDTMLLLGHKSWDYAAGVILIREAGGVVTNFEGGEWGIDDPNLVASGNEMLHRQFLESLRRDSGR